MEHDNYYGEDVFLNNEIAFFQGCDFQLVEIHSYIENEKNTQKDCYIFLFDCTSIINERKFLDFWLSSHGRFF